MTPLIAQHQACKIGEQRCEPLCRGEGNWQRFERYAGQVMEDREFFIPEERQRLLAAFRSS